MVENDPPHVGSTVKVAADGEEAVSFGEPVKIVKTVEIVTAEAMIPLEQMTTRFVHPALMIDQSGGDKRLIMKNQFELLSKDTTDESGEAEAPFFLVTHKKSGRKAASNH